MSTLPRNIQNISGEMTSQNILPRRTVRAPAPPPPTRQPARVNNALRARVAAQSNAAALRRRQALVPVNIATVRSPSANLNKWFRNHNLPPPNDTGLTRKNWLGDLAEFNATENVRSRAKKLLQNLTRQANQRQAPARQANQRPPNLNLTQFERANTTSVYNSAKNLIRTLKSKNYKQLNVKEKNAKLIPWLGHLFKNNLQAMRNFAARLPYEKTNIESLRGESIKKNWNKSTNRVKRLLWSVSKRNSS
jgi:hypothetical protein